MTFDYSTSHFCFRLCFSPKRKLLQFILNMKKYWLNRKLKPLSKAFNVSPEFMLRKVSLTRYVEKFMERVKLFNKCGKSNTKIRRNLEIENDVIKSLNKVFWYKNILKKNKNAEMAADANQLSSQTKSILQAKENRIHT